jgi:hypothetical protein
MYVQHILMLLKQGRYFNTKSVSINGKMGIEKRFMNEYKIIFR